MSRADVSFRDKEARVAFDPAQVGVEQLIEAVNRIGFRASLKRQADCAPAFGGDKPVAHTSSPIGVS